MPKAKTNKTLSKRVRKTASGKLIVRRKTTQHLVARASKRASKRSGKYINLSATLKRGINRLLPNY